MSEPFRDDSIVKLRFAVGRLLDPPPRNMRIGALETAMGPWDLKVVEAYRDWLIGGEGMAELTENHERGDTGAAVGGES